MWESSQKQKKKIFHSFHRRFFYVICYSFFSTANQPTSQPLTVKRQFHDTLAKNRLCKPIFKEHHQKLHNLLSFFKYFFYTKDTWMNNVCVSIEKCSNNTLIEVKYDTDLFSSISLPYKKIFFAKLTLKRQNGISFQLFFSSRIWLRIQNLCKVNKNKTRR